MRAAARRLPGTSCGPACASSGRCSRPADPARLLSAWQRDPSARAGGAALCRRAQVRCRRAGESNAIVREGVESARCATVAASIGCPRCLREHGPDEIAHGGAQVSAATAVDPAFAAARVQSDSGDPLCVCARVNRELVDQCAAIGVNRSMAASNCQRGFGATPVAVCTSKKPLTSCGPSPSAT